MSNIILNEVLTTKEACERYNIADCTVRSWIKEKLLTENEVRKSGNTWIVLRQALESLLREKKLYGRTFNIEGRTISADTLLFREKTLQSLE